MARTGALAKPRALLWGSDASIETHTLAAFRSARCEVLLATDRRQAIDATHHSHVDVLVLNFRLHSREFSQLATIASLVIWPCRILVLADSLEQLALAIEAPVGGVLVKPLDPEQLRAVVHSLRTDVLRRAAAERMS